MNRLLSRLDLKVDAIAIEEGNSHLVIYHVNVPSYMCNNPDTKRGAFERVRDLLIEDFQNLDLEYEITTAYHLIHKETGAERFWHGSFQPKEENPPAVLSNFQTFNRLTFVDSSMAATQNVEKKLQWHGTETVWMFSRLDSIIFNAQAKVRSGSKLFESRFFNIRTKSKRVVFAIE